MIHHLYHSVIPNKKNRFKPHILQGKVLWLGILLMYGLQLNYNVALGSGKLLGYATNISSSQLVSLTNQERASEGLGSLSTDSRLVSAATAKANDMIAKDYWAHTSPSGKEPWEFILDAGYSYSYAGENLAYGFSTSSGTMTGWMNSPGHRANILNANYSEVGFAVVNGSNYQGGENTLVVAMYGHPAGAPAPSSGDTGGSTKPQKSEASQPSTPTPAAETPQAQEEPAKEPKKEEAKPEQEDESKDDSEDDDVVALPQPTEPTTPDTEQTSNEPMFVWEGLSWPALTAVSFFGIAGLSSALRHFHFWQHHKPKHLLHWLKTHPVFQTLALIAGLLAILSTGMGVVA